MIGINIGPRVGNLADGRLKDTARNIYATEQYVINIADETMATAVHESSTEWPAAVSEVERLGLDLVDSEVVSVPRLADVPISMECRLRYALRFGTVGEEFVVGEVLAFHVRDGLYVDGKIETEVLRPLARIAGPNYASIGTVMRRVEQRAALLDDAGPGEEWAGSYPDEAVFVFPPGD